MNTYPTPDQMYEYPRTHMDAQGYHVIPPYTPQYAETAQFAPPMPMYYFPGQYGKDMSSQAFNGGYGAYPLFYNTSGYQHPVYAYPTPTYEHHPDTYHQPEVPNGSSMLEYTTEVPGVVCEPRPELAPLHSFPFPEFHEATPLPSPPYERQYSHTSPKQTKSRLTLNPKRFRKPVVIEDHKHTTQPGPIPATKKPRLILVDGEEALEFYYSMYKIIKKFTLKCGTHQNILGLENHVDQAIVTGELTQKFMEDNCVYPRALCHISEYTGNRYNYERQCNKIGWFLSFKNPDVINGKRGLLQRAVDSWRNTRMETKFKSRRVRNQLKEE